MLFPAPSHRCPLAQWSTRTRSSRRPGRPGCAISPSPSRAGAPGCTVRLPLRLTESPNSHPDAPLPTSPRSTRLGHRHRGARVRLHGHQHGHRGERPRFRARHHRRQSRAAEGIPRPARLGAPPGRILRDRAGRGQRRCGHPDARGCPTPPKSNSASERSCIHPPHHPPCQAEKKGDEWVINGSKMWSECSPRLCCRV